MVVVVFSAGTVEKMSAINPDFPSTVSFSFLVFDSSNLVVLILLYFRFAAVGCDLLTGGSLAVKVTGVYSGILGVKLEEVGMAVFDIDEKSDIYNYGLSAAVALL